MHIEEAMHISLLACLILNLLARLPHCRFRDTGRVISAITQSLPREKEREVMAGRSTRHTHASRNHTRVQKGAQNVAREKRASLLARNNSFIIILSEFASG